VQTLSKDLKQEFLFLQGGGEMGELTRNYDWSKTSIGSPADWPQSLQTTVSLILNSRFPMFLWWGQELIQFYNDAYRPSLGNNGKHPAALGQRGEECWAEIWTTIKPLIYQVLTGGPSTWSEDQLIPIYRNGRLEDVYWTFGHSAVKDESGNVGGVLVVCQETTDKVLSLQRLEESKQQLEFAIDATELATWDLDPVTDTFTANSRYAEWFGIPAHTKTSNEAAFSMIADEDRERIKEAYTKALDYSSKTKFDIEYKICPPGKPVRILRAKGKVWFNEEKIAYRFNGTLQDVTDQVTNRIKLEESEQRFRSLIKEAPIATSLLVGRELKIEVANQAVLDLWGKGNNVVGKTLEEAIPELQGQHFLQTLDDVFTTGKGFSIKADPAVLIKDGVPHNLFFDFTNKPLFDSKGKVWAILSMGVDVTEQVVAGKE
jgi:PAS domain-containing protein